MGARSSAVEPPARPEIAASWARSSRSGVTGDHLAPPAAPGADPRGRLATLASPVLDRLGATLADSRTTVVLTDAHAGILDRRVGTRSLAALLDGVGLVPGFSYAEDVVGTNGMGTAAEERRPVRVAGEEHYTEALRALTCVGVPIEHPVTGRLEGVLDLTCFNEDAGPWMGALADEAVAGVRSLLEAQATVAERALLSAFLRASRRAPGAVVSLNESFVLTNPAAARLLDGADHGALWELGSAAVRGGAQRTREVRLAGGSLVRAHVDVVAVGDRVVGATLRLEAAREGQEPEATSDRHPAADADGAEGAAGPGHPRPHTRAPLGGATGAGLTTRLVDEVAAGVEAGDRTLLHGPSGSGKATVANLALAGIDVAAFDAARAVVDGAGHWLAAVEEALGAGRPVLVRHLDALAAEAAAGLAAVLDAAPAAIVVATRSEHPAAAGDAAQALADRFGRLVRVPGVAGRADELPGLVRSTLGKLVPTGAVRAAPEVVQALSRVDLPGNLRQLEAVLHRVVVRRRTGTITLDDLPPEIRAATHRPHLTAMEQHECEAIAAALAASDGNKAAAAAALGISRSTLYRKLEAYGLHLEHRAW